MLGLFRNRQSSSWHRSITHTAAEHHPVNISTDAPTPNPNFPWLKLQEHTDEYVKKKKKLSPEQLEARLVEFIRIHADRMDVAIAACGHRLRSEVLRGLLLSDLNVAPGRSLSMSTYLQAIVAANRVNPVSVSDIEAQRANSMIAAAVIGASSPGQYLHELVKIVIAGVPPTFLIYTHLHALALKACTDFAAQLQSLRDAGQLRRAQTAASWLSNISEIAIKSAPENLGPEQLLDIAFPTWKSWARWNPNKERLVQWEQFSADERIPLKSLLALEGPDFVGRHDTMWEEILHSNNSSGISTLSSSTVRVGDLILEPRLAADTERTIYRLLVCIDAAAKSGPSDAGLLIYQCAGKTITDDALQLLEVIRAAGEPLISPLLLATYGAGKEPRSAQMTAAMRLLPLLEHGRRQTLRDLIFPHLVAFATDSIKNMQAKLKSQLESDKVLDEIEIDLQEFGNSMLNNVWILPFLDEHLLTLLGEWPTKADVVALNMLRRSTEARPESNKSILLKKINNFSKDRFIERGTIGKPEERLVEALISVWDEPPNNELQSVALYVAQLPGLDSKSICRCLSLLPLLQPSFVLALIPILQNMEKHIHIACAQLAKLLAPIPPSTSDPTHSWRLVLYELLKARDVRVVGNSLKEFKAAEWIKFLCDLQSACGSIDTRGDPPRMLDPVLLAWGQRLKKYQETLASLERDLAEHLLILKSLLYVDEDAVTDYIEAILQSFQKAAQTQTTSKPAMLAIIKLLTYENVAPVSKVLPLLITSSKEATDACMRVLELHHGSSTILVAEALLTSWVNSSDMSQLDKSMLKALAEMLGIDTSSKTGTPTASLEAAADYLDAQFAALFAEAQRLEGIRAAYKRVDSAGISKLLSHLKIEDPSPIEDLLASLPSSLVDVVEMVDNEVVEMQFPLNVTPLQQIAMGVGNAQSLIVRLSLTDYPKQPGFCIHLGNEKKMPANSRMPPVHIPWDISMESIFPDHIPCHGRPNRTSYQLTRVLRRYLQSGFNSLEEMHNLVSQALKDITTTCLICGTTKATQLRRSGVCDQHTCSTIFQRASLEIRLAEIRNDPPAMDLLLTMVHYAAASKKLELLPGCPFPNTLAVANALHKIPNLSKLGRVDDLTTAVQKLGSNTEKLLSWTALNYGGFLASATGKMKIPGWPAGTHQFLLANARPNLEATFRQQIGNLPTRVLWHGTSLERLFAITTEGLKICSNTSLQAHGAASGPGIYTADNPQTSWSYSTQTSGSNWSGSSISNVRVLLGLEAAGPAVGSGIHVVTNVSSLIVRYVFLVPSSATIPAPTIVGPPMLSVYNSLRAGAL